jgi:protein-S-isoprenylcysteine O-methyltransferase Ste14
MLLDTIERWVGWLGAAGIVAMSAVVTWSALQARSRQKGRISGRGIGLINSPWFLLFGSVVSLAVCWWLWRPLPIIFSDGARIALLVAGCILYFGGLALTVWGRIALGEMHNVSTTAGAELFEGHRLITAGPFNVVRNPMYVGAMLMGIGGLLLYRTWTLVLLALCPLAFIRRARREEEALSAEFGQEWADYCRRVPGWIPRLGRAEPTERKETKPA